MASGVAAYLAKVDRVFMPESGQGALGPCLVTVGQAYEDYRNHPLFTNRMSEFLDALLGHRVQFEFPRIWFTKGETLRAYVSKKSKESANWSKTRSCWQDSRTVSVDRQRRQCGICAACMLRRLSVHAAGLVEPKENYVWEDLSSETFEASVAPTFDKRKITRSQQRYAIAGTLHLDHLAGLAQSAIHKPTIKSNASALAGALGLSEFEAQAKLARLLKQHEIEWANYLALLGPRSFIANWTAQG
jgi:hypothetical protein